jgi:three-Cys-motif partner protein
MGMDKYLLPEDDGLPTRVFGAWTTEKLDYVRRYIYMFETSMRGKPWRQRSYIDLYAGTGKYRAEENGEVHLGSALLALTTEHPFTHYYFVESDSDNLNTLKQRCQPATQKIRFYEGDANQKVNEIVNEIISVDKQKIPNQWSSLNLAFLDPDGLELEWKTVEALAKVNKMDLIIYYSQFGLNLNLKNCYQTKSATTIDKFFGDDEWRRIFEKWKLKDSIAGIHRDLIDYYKSKLHTLGYVDVVEPETGVEPLMRTSKTKAPLYRLLFASKNELGHEFWKKVTRKDVWGQGRLL